MSENNGWLPIETAPKDGTEILVTIDKYSRVVRWVPSMTSRAHGHFPWVCQSGDNAWRADVPTHWQPLPPPPETHTQEA